MNKIYDYSVRLSNFFPHCLLLFKYSCLPFSPATSPQPSHPHFSVVLPKIYRDFVF